MAETLGGPGATYYEDFPHGMPIPPLPDPVASTPPPNYYLVTNMYVTSDGKVQVDYDTAEGTSPYIFSSPPGDGLRVVNLYVDPVTTRLTVEYED